jgi:hypothetical protein
MTPLILPSSVRIGEAAICSAAVPPRRFTAVT